VEAFLELLDEGELLPTAKRVAERAGVSLRSVYVRFADLDSLAVSAAERQWERIRPLATVVDASLPLARRLLAFVEQRCRVLEAIMPVRRAAHLQEPFSSALHELLANARAVSRAEIARVFRTELSRRRGRSRDRLLDALDVACGSMTWEALRHHQGLSTADATDVVAETLASLFGPRANLSDHRSK
jgi:AcrR family transcriptional regulator